MNRRNSCSWTGVAADGCAHVARDPAPIVAHGDGAIWVQRDLDRRRVPCECLVYRVVHHLVDKVVQPTCAS
eukprot:6199270-Pleurochrysis_carterae.AAC.4